MLHALTRWIRGASRRQPARKGVRGKLSLLRLEERATPAVVGAMGSGPGINATVIVIDETGGTIATLNPYPGFFGGANAAVADITGDGVKDVVVGPGEGGGPHVRVYDGAALIGGITTPLYDLAPVFPGAYNLGVYVAAGDLDGDGHADVIVGPGPGGGPVIRAFNVWVDGNNAVNNVMFEFSPYQELGTHPGAQPFRFGVRVAAADFGGDNGGVPGSKTLGTAEIATAPGPGGGPHITFWDYEFNRFPTPNGLDLNNVPNEYYGNLVPVETPGFAGFHPDYRGGFSLAGGYYTNNKDEDGFVYADLAIAADVGPLPNQQGGPHMLTYRLDGFFSPNQQSDAIYIPANAPPGINEATGLPEDVQPNAALATRFNYGTFGWNPGFPELNSFFGGSRIAAIADLNNDDIDELFVAPGKGVDQVTGDVPTVRIDSGIDGSLFIDFGRPFGVNFQGGVFVG